MEGERGRRRVIRDAAGHLGQAEVEQLGAGLREHHVGRLQVPMHDPGAMREGQALGDLDRAGDRLRRWHRSVRQPRRQRRAVELLHHQEHRAVLLADVVQRADVGMGEGGDCRRFPFEARPASGVVGEFPRQHLDGDAALEPRVPGRVDLAHATGAQRTCDLVGTETCSGRQRHWRGDYTSGPAQAMAARCECSCPTFAPRADDRRQCCGGLGDSRVVECASSSWPVMSTRGRAAGTRRPVHRGAPVGRATVSTSRCRSVSR